MSVRITTLIENSPGEHLALKSEHGLSFFIEKDTHSILFDTGQSSGFLSNAAELRLDVGSVSHLILSHGHYDHSGGLRSLVARHSGFRLLVGNGFFDEKYAARNGAYEFLGNNFDEEFLVRNTIEYAVVDAPLTEIVDGIFIVSGFHHSHLDEQISPRFVLRKDGHFVPDTFRDEVLVAVDSPRGLIVLLGCAHPGMQNMIDTVKSRIDRPIYGILGGTHLVEASTESMKSSVEYLSDETLQIVGVSHCTGAKAMEILSESNPRFFHNRTGTTLIVD